jgi:predicted peroxiredoxin
VVEEDPGVRYLLIESRCERLAASGRDSHSLAKKLADAGNEVTLLLVQNGVLGARKGAKDERLSALVGRVTVLADDFSLRERGIPEADLVAGVAVSTVDTIVELVATGARALWH